MTEDLTQELAAKELALTELENKMETIETAQELILDQIHNLSTEITKLQWEKKDREGELRKLAPGLRIAKRQHVQLKREHSQLFRQYLAQRDQMKGMR